MTFFEDQRTARKKTSLLVGYLVLAVIGIVISVYIAVVLCFQAGFEGTFEPTSNLWYPKVFFFTTIIVLCVVTLGSLYKIYSLRSGGKTVALALGGRLISPNTTNPQERKLLNVVEEIAIASGTAVPPVYLMSNEEGVNAFAAGHSINSAVIGVTRGCMELLNREELQGVIAHEFSHIINGDMKTNLRLLGISHGLLIIGITGYWIFRSSLNMGGSRRSRQSKRSAAEGGPIIFGLTLYVIGYIGVLFGRLIRSAISRQREYLADASAVQFTRTPHGIAGALKKIGGLTNGSHIQSDNAEEVSHMFFADGLKHSFFQVFATHPPLAERIRRIDPKFSNFQSIDYETVALQTRSGEISATELNSGISSFSDSTGSTPQIILDPEKIGESVGSPTPEHLVYAHNVLQAIPPSILSEAHEPFGARALIYLLLLDPELNIRASQIAELNKNEDPAVMNLVLALEDQVSALSPEARLPLVDICIPSLRLLSESQYLKFRSILHTLATADGACSLFEYCLHFVLLRHVGSSYGRSKQPFRRPSLDKAMDASCNLLRILAIAGHNDVDLRKAAFDRAMIRFQCDSSKTLNFEGEPSLDDFDHSLKILINSEMSIKEPLITAAAACIAADGKVSIDEAELLRTIADALECPLPPLLSEL